jgi:hypothetical protein
MNMLDAMLNDVVRTQGADALTPERIEGIKVLVTAHLAATSVRFVSSARIGPKRSGAKPRERGGCPSLDTIPGERSWARQALIRSEVPRA